MPRITTVDMIRQWLESRGCDALYLDGESDDPEDSCGCCLSDFMPCRGYRFCDDCVAARWKDGKAYPVEFEEGDNV
jgi:hypothetical protein